MSEPKDMEAKGAKARVETNTKAGADAEAGANDNAGENAANALASGDGEAETGCEVMFYHLTRQPLEQVLPPLLHKTLQRQKRALVRCGNLLRVRALSDAVWTWREEAFIAHGTPEDGHVEKQPVLIVPADWRADDDGGNAAPNGAQFLFCVEGAQPGDADLTRFARVCILFSDMDSAGKEQARELWRALKDRNGLRLSYWQQEPRGGWERKA